jgi:hypothetical protein
MNSNLVDYKATDTKTNTQIITAPTSEGKLDEKINNIKTTTQSQINKENTMNTIDTVNLEEYVENSNTEETSNNNEEAKDYRWRDYAKNYLLNTQTGAIKGFLDLGEGVIDTHIYIAQLLTNTAAHIYYNSEIGSSQFSPSNITREKKEDTWNYDWANNIIATDYSTIVTENFFGDYHRNRITTKGEGLGGTMGKIGGNILLSKVPYVGAVLTSFAEGGVATEKAYQTEAELGGETRHLTVFLKTGIGAAIGLAAGKFAGSKKLNWSKSEKLVNGLFRNSEGKINISSILNGAKTGAVESFKLKNIGSVIRNIGPTIKDDPNFYINASATFSNLVMSIFGEYTPSSKVSTRFFADLGKSATNAMADAVTKNVVKEAAEEVVENIIS